MSHCPTCRSTNNTPTGQPPTIREGDHADAAGHVHTHAEFRFVTCDDCGQRYAVRRSFTPTRRTAPEQPAAPPTTSTTTSNQPTPPKSAQRQRPQREPQKRARQPNKPATATATP